MKHLFENWRKHLKEADPTPIGPNSLDRNAAAIREINDMHFRVGTMLTDLWGFNWKQIGDLEVFLSHIPALFEENNTITALAGIGTKGIVFELDNGHVLKFFSHGYRGDETGTPEMEFYASEKSKIFNKEGDITTLPIYDKGSAMFPGRSESTYWVEMAKVVTFGDYMKKTGRDPESIEFLSEHLTEIFLTKEALESESNLRDEERRLKARIAGLTKLVLAECRHMELCAKEFLGIFNTIKAVYERYGKDFINDLHEGNIGILEPTLPRVSYPRDGIKGSVSCKDMDIPAFILFDP